MQILTTEQLSDFLEYGFSTLPQLKLSDSAREKIKMLAIDQNQIYAESDKVLEIIFSDTKVIVNNL